MGYLGIHFSGVQVARSASSPLVKNFYCGDLKWKEAKTKIRKLRTSRSKLPTQIHSQAKGTRRAFVGLLGYVNSIYIVVASYFYSTGLPRFRSLYS